MLVRDATPGDTEALVKMLRDLHQEAPNAYPEPDDEEIHRSVERMEDLRAVNKARWFVAEDEDGLCGFLFAVAMKALFTKSIVAGDEIFYVRPEKRGSRAAVMLVRAFESWSREIGAFGSFLVFGSGIKTDAAAPFAERLGYRRYGVEYFKTWAA